MAENVSGHIPVRTLILKDSPVREVPNGAIALVDDEGNPVEFLPSPSGDAPAYSEEPADLAAALVRAGLMQGE